jgi:cullin 3
MLDDDKYGDLQRLYKLFGRPNVTEGPSVLKSALKKSIAVRGDAINEGITGGMANGSSGAPAGTTANVTNGDMDAEAAAATSRAKGKGKETDGSVSASGTGMSAAAAASAALRWVQDVLDLKDKFDRILRDGFSDDKGVQTAINEVSWGSTTFGAESVRCFILSRLVFTFARRFKRSSTRTRKRQSTFRCSSMRT